MSSGDTRTRRKVAVEGKLIAAPNRRGHAARALQASSNCAQRPVPLKPTTAPKKRVAFHRLVKKVAVIESSAQSGLESLGWNCTRLDVTRRFHRF
jgi:hypothetical protein